MGNSLRVTTLASAIGFALISASFSPAAHAAPVTTTKATSSASANTRETYIIRFTEPGLLHYSGGTQGLAATAPSATHERKLDARSPAAHAYGNYLASQRSAYLQSIAQAIGHNVDVKHSYLVTMNGVSADLSLSEATKIAKLPGVASVKRAGEQHLTTYRGPEFIGAPSIWDGSAVPGSVATRGQGVVVGVIDSGANSTHPSFADDVTCGVFNAGNHKLLSAVDCSSTDGGGLCDGPNPEANNGNGHGVHTASTAVGNTLDATASPPPVIPAPYTTMSGVAPCASLRTYKVCETNQCSGAAILAGTENAITDGVDVINFSISGGTDPWNDSDRTFLDAVGADIFVSASAGNTSAGTPNPIGEVNHLGPWVNTVAASTHDLNVSGTGLLSVTGPGTPPPNLQNIVMTPGSGTNAGDPITATDIRHYAANEIGCTANGGFPPDYFSGAVALISRGTCTFEEKINNAQAAGAVLAVIYNNAAGVLTMSVGGATLPAYMIQQVDGQNLITFIDASGGGPADRIFADGFEVGTAGGSAVVDFTPAVQQGDVIAGFSLRGPSALTSITKPDITGPGVNIYAALDSATTGGYGYLSGTSMSSPHLAGSAALVRAAHPDWTPAETKSAMMLTAFTNGTEEDTTTPWTPDDVGSGRVDLTKAALAGFVLNETFANFLAAEPPGGDPKTLNIASARNMNCVDSCDWTRTLRNTLTAPSSWTVTVNAPAGLDVSVDTPSFSFTGGIGETHPITITAAPTTTLTDVTYAEVVFHEASGAAPDAHFYVAVKGSGSGGGGDIVTGTIDEDVLNDPDGSTFDFITESWGVYNPGRVDDINLYNFGDAMYVYWYGDVAGVSVGGVVDGGGVDFAVLHSGDVVGPASTISAASIQMVNWINGADGYIGIAFENEDTGLLNYGYIHLTTTSPDGFPAHAFEWGYNSAGDAITIP